MSDVIYVVAKVGKRSTQYRVLKRLVGLRVDEVAIKVTVNYDRAVFLNRVIDEKEITIKPRTSQSLLLTTDEAYISKTTPELVLERLSGKESDSDIRQLKEDEWRGNNGQSEPKGGI